MRPVPVEAIDRRRSVRKLTEDRPAEDPLPYAIMNDPVYSAKLAACQTLTRLGNKLKTPEDRVALANEYPVFTALQPLLSSSNEMLVDACRTALALYSASQDFPFVLQLLRSVGAPLLDKNCQLMDFLVINPPEHALWPPKSACPSSGLQRKTRRSRSPRLRRCSKIYLWLTY